MRALVRLCAHFLFRSPRFAQLLLALALGAETLGRAADESTAPVCHDYVSRRWLTEDGLPHNVVTRIQQDRTGYLWLATPAGLTRFDGREFKVYLPPNRGTGGGRNVRDLAVLEDGTVL